MNQSRDSIIGCAAVIALAWGCSSAQEDDSTDSAMATTAPTTSAPAGEMPAASGPAPGATQDAPPATVTPTGVPTPDEQLIEENEPEMSAAPDPDIECASSSTGTSLEGVVLAFTFDVSGSMGSHSQPYFAREYKWEPVVAATKAFFSDVTSAGVSATLTFFPNDQAPLVGGGGGNQGDACYAEDYEVPDVSMTSLPSDAFATAIDGITPAGDGDWRQGTPTGPALEGTIAAVEAMRAVEPNAKYVIVLVTDGEPALCSNEQNDIDYVAGVAAGVADDIPTYVIGVGNPAVDEVPDPPTDGIDNLHTIAAAGGTGEAFLIDTDDPVQTSADFRAVIDSIRENSFNCAVEIPEPPSGQMFDSTKVNVNYENLEGLTPLTYDPTCTDPAAWHYDDEDDPSVILLCESICTEITNDGQGEGQLDVEFGCLSRTAAGAR